MARATLTLYMTDTCDCWNIPMVDALLPHASHGPGQDVLLAGKP